MSITMIVPVRPMPALWGQAGSLRRGPGSRPWPQPVAPAVPGWLRPAAPAVHHHGPGPGRAALGLVHVVQEV